MIDPEVEGRRGGNITKERHGSAHFSKAAKIGRANLFKRDPEYGKRQAEIMQKARMAKYYERQLKEQRWIAAELGERLKIASDKNSSTSFLNRLMGQG